MNSKEHAFWLGKLMGNLQALEFILRWALYKQKSKPHQAFERAKNLNTLSSGDEVPINAYTDYSTLSVLIDRYNREVADDAKNEVDKKIVELRDSLVHGRVSSDSPTGTMQLLKFEEPVGKKVKVSFAQSMNTDWFRSQIKRVEKEIKKIHSYAKLG